MTTDNSLRLIEVVGKSLTQLKTTQYKKLALNDLRFRYQNLKSHKSHEKNETKNIRPLFLSFSPIDRILMFFFVFLCGLQDFKF